MLYATFSIRYKKRCSTCANSNLVSYSDQNCKLMQSKYIFKLKNIKTEYFL